MVLPDIFIDQDSPAAMYEKAGLDSRGIVATKGGSFGFRGIRYELVEPKPEDGDPFLRVALGYRGGSSCNAMTELLAELANG
jgi:hypothetical protein